MIAISALRILEREPQRVEQLRYTVDALMGG